MKWQRELDLATRIAREAGEVTMRWFRAGPLAGTGGPAAAPTVETKADGSPVTIADREAERLLRDRIAAAFPDDGILGEEWGEEAGTSGRRWILDPIDGTKSFIHGVPLYGVMVALEADGDAVVGVLRFPPLDETVAAAKGAGCAWNGHPASVSSVDRLDNALVLTTEYARIVSTTSPPSLGSRSGEDGLAARANGLAGLAGRAGIVRTWGDCYGYALVATGRAEAMLDPTLNAWDAAAVRPIIEEAGGVFTDWDGNPSHLSGSAVATNAALADEVRRCLS
ncbi:MAG TPA: inositol monophosphatase family protein [Longimicrobiales bacterium]|nr:inositol monophosphatase family protein [Longimicrobiales bacterium]